MLAEGVDVDEGMDVESTKSRTINGSLGGKYVKTIKLYANELLTASSATLNLAKNHICFVYFLPPLNIIED